MAADKAAGEASAPGAVRQRDARGCADPARGVGGARGGDSRTTLLWGVHFFSPASASRWLT